MARQIQDIILRLKNEGFEGLDKIRSSFRELGKVTGFTENDIQRLRKEILNFGDSSDKTTQSLRGQLDVLKALQAQATVNSRVYTQLGKDIKAIGGAYKQAAEGVKVFTEAQLRTQKPGARPIIFGQQIAQLRQDLQQLSIYSKEYSAKLTEIRQRELPFNLAQGRQNVIAAEAAYRLGPQLANAATNLPTVPNTAAGVSQTLNELRDRLTNVTLKGDEWRKTVIEIAQEERKLANAQRALNKELTDAPIQSIISNINNRIQAARNINSGFAAFSQSIDIPTLKAIERNRTKLEAAAAARSGPLQGPVAPSELFSQLGKIADQASINKTQLLGRSYDDVAASIRKVSLASDGSLNSLRAQRQTWELLRNSLGDNVKALRTVDKELTDLDRRISARERPRGRKGFTGLGAAQTAGAVISGGIFGGPEGLLGGLLGAAGGFAAGGGPAALGGAFAGAAIGAQVGIFRQQAAAVGEYSRELNLAKVTLAQAATSQKEYNQLLEAARNISSDYSVRFKDTITGYAQVATAARANNLSLKETENIYRGIIAAGTAFGKSQQDLDAIVTATVQVLSKGKLSAEELSGQLGERLPGAVAKFAAATGRSLPELAKALQDGKVPISDFVKFAEKQLTDYDKIAQTIASSPEKAGARLQLALDLAAENYGNFFQRINTYALDGLTKLVNLLNTNQKEVKIWVTSFVNAGITVANNFRALANYLTPVIDFLSERFKRFYALMQANPGVALANFVRDKLFGGINASQNQSQLKVSDLFPEFKPPSFGSTVNVKPGDFTQDNLKKAREDAAKKALADAQAAADQQQQLNVALAKNQIELAKTVYEAKKRLQEREYELQLELDNLAAEAYLTKLSGAARTSYELAIEYAQKVDAVNKSIADAAARKAQAEQNLNYSRAMERVSSMAPGVSGPTSRPQPAAGLSAAQLRAYNDPNISANSPYYPIGQMVGGDAPVRQRGQAISQMRQYISTTTDVEQAIIQLTYAYTDLELVQENATKTLPLLQTIYNDKLTKSYAQQTEALKDATEIDQLRLRLQRAGTDPAVITYNVDLLKIRKQLAGDIAGQKAALDTGKQTQVQYTDNVKNLTQAATDNAKALRDNAEAAYALDNALSRVQDTNIDKGFNKGISEYITSIGTLRSNITDLTVNGIKGLEDAIFSLVTTGSANFKEFAANILQETARIIIRQLILRTVLNSLFPAPATQFPDLTSAFKLNAYGNVYAKNGIQPFAMGGIVNKPTLFRYANGGIPGTGLMGEAGPEAIIPLQRGANGKLGVAGGGGTYNVTVNVEAGGTTTQTQGDPGQGAQLGRVIAGAVQAELIKQQRPGGLLAQR
jgi:lambda family phage tail tape measure protein